MNEMTKRATSNGILQPNNEIPRNCNQWIKLILTVLDILSFVLVLFGIIEEEFQGKT